MRHNSTFGAGRTLWGTLVGAASSEQDVKNPSRAVETPKTDTTSDQASRVFPQVPAQQPLATATALATDGTHAQPFPSATATASPGGVSKSGLAVERVGTAARLSTNDLELLQSLAAKLKELTDPGTAKVPAGVPQRPDSDPASGSPTAVPAAIASEDTGPIPRTSSAHLNARHSTGVLAGSPSLDSSQTVRALTAKELADSEASRWFAIQLILSPNRIDAAEVPNLDIFGEYRLYSVTEPEQGRLMHALRLGFFSSEVAAESVARYLAVYFPPPTIRRVSIAECERFADKLVTAGKDIGASGMHAVIELAGIPAPLPQARRVTTSTAAPAAPGTAPAATPARGRKPAPRATSWPWSRRSKSHSGPDR